MNNYALKSNPNSVDNSDDLYILNGQIARVTGNDQIAQRIKTLLRTFMGEYFLDQTLGVPYFQEIFQKPANKAVFDAIIKNNILSVNGVVNIASFDSDLSARTYSINCTVLDADGQNIPFNLSMGQ